MERSSTGDEVIAGQPGSESAARHDDVALLGQPHSAGGPEVCSEVAPTADRLRGPVTVPNLLRLLEHQQYRCALTGRLLTPDTASLDHVRPVRRGGLHVIENAQVLHRDVNRAKSTMTTEEFIQLCREIVRHADAKGSADAW